MKRFALVLPFLLFVLAGVGLAQIGPPPHILPHQFFPTAAVAYTGPGDVVSGAKVFYSCTRAYTAAYAAAAGKACNLRRDSDNHTCDFLFAASGGVGNSANCSTGTENGTAMATWCNATTCHVVTAYDHTANLNVTQATAANQPPITFNCQSTTFPCVGPGNGTSTGLNNTTTWTSTALPNSMAAVAFHGGTANKTVLGIQATAANAIISTNTSPNFSMSNNAGCTLLAGGIAGKWNALSSGWPAPTATANCRNNTSTVTATVSSPNNSLGQPAWMVATGGSSGWFDGYSMEAGFWWTTQFSTAQLTSMCQNQQAYYGSSHFGSVC